MPMDNYEFFANLAILAIILLVIFWPKKPARNGTLTTRAAHNYPYTLGNNFQTEGKRMNGISVTIPKTLPHIYLDNHADSRTRGPRFTFHNSQRVMLEGDFNKYFQLFVPKQFHNQALSILSPDVMQTLIKSNQKYDVEIHGRRINIISAQRLKLKQSTLDELQKIALQLLEEIEHKLKSWSKTSEAEAQKAHLTFYDEESVKLFGRYIGVARLAVIVSFLIGAMFYVMAYTFWQQEKSEPFMLLALAILFFPGVPYILWDVKRTKS